MSRLAMYVFNMQYKLVTLVVYLFRLYFQLSSFLYSIQAHLPTSAAGLGVAATYTDEIIQAMYRLGMETCSKEMVLYQYSQHPTSSSDWVVD